MQIISIICEYNPFHNGHLYHIKKVKEMFPNSLIILILNGYFLERGEVSIISKENKTKLAILNGIDLVIELPFVYGTQSADIFASTSIKILNELRAEYIVFGSESNNIEEINKIVDYQINNKKEYDLNIKNYLKNGTNYPTAMAKALNIDFDFKPNDLLAISYIKAIKLNNYNIIPISIKRTSDYLDTLANDKIVSATNIREKLNNNVDISKYVPNEELKYIENITLNNYFPYIKYKILTDKDLSIYLDVDEGIEYRLKKVINECNTIDDLIEKVKTKRYTYNKLRRMLIHILIGFTKQDNLNLVLDYIKILGFNEKGKKYLNNIKKDMHIPIIVSKNSLIYKYELISASIYDLVSKYNNRTFENNNKPIKL